MSKTAVAIKERPIPMTGNSPSAILEDRKTQTRRLWGLKRVNISPDDWELLGINTSGLWEFRNKHDKLIVRCKCPYGKVGDRLWGKETWQCSLGYITHQVYADYSIVPVYYRADGQLVRKCCPQSYLLEHHLPSNWQSSRFMPRWASRILLEITGVRGERVQGISKEDAKEEGANPFLLEKLRGGTKYKMMKTYHHEVYPLVDHADKDEVVVFECPNMGFARLHHTQWQDGQDPVFRIPAQEVFGYVGALEPDYKNGFRILWDSLNAKRGYGWDTNPWVGVISFRKVENNG